MYSKRLDRLPPYLFARIDELKEEITVELFEAIVPIPSARRSTK
jgi:hypothetical protein